MAQGKCFFCTNAAKYKCPKCAAGYCSVACFKSEQHVHPAGESLQHGQDRQDQSSQNDPSQITETVHTAQSEQARDEGSLDLAKIADDPVIKKLLTYKALHVHLSVILKLLNDSLLTNEPLAESRKEIANMRLCDVRIGGPEENELVEEFVLRVLELTQTAN